jgi:hypothetical protein
LLATFILHRGGYGLNGFFSLEEHHARDLGGYYRSLSVHPHHNYYEGRWDADLAIWLEYFARTLARVFTAAKDEALHYSARGVPVEPEELRRLDHRARTVLALFTGAEQVTTPHRLQLLWDFQNVWRACCSIPGSKMAGWL